jgi:alpha-galactosidase
MQTLASEAFLEKDLTKAFQACLIDPCTAACAAPRTIRACFNELLEADRPWLEPYWGDALSV